MKRKALFVVQDKGGQGKSLLTANLWEWVNAQTPGAAWRLVEVEQRLNLDLFSQPRYFGAAAVTQLCLATYSDRTKRTTPSLDPLDELVKFAEEGANLVIDFGASTYGLFSLWLQERKGYKPFLAAGYEFVFLVPVCGDGDAEAAMFYNQNHAFMSKLGQVVLVRNFKDGTRFNKLDADKVGRAIDVLEAVDPLAADLHNDTEGLRRTFGMAMADDTLCFRSRTDAEDILRDLHSQFTSLKDILVP
jgi:hypothetical protein